MSLQGTTIKSTDLSTKDIHAMYRLMLEYYSNVSLEKFQKDLREKDWVVIFKDVYKKIKGFSTLMIMDIDVDGKVVKTVFSGDTVIHKDHWGKLDLPMVWGTFVLLQLPDMYKDHDLYWILISKGYKTYRYLPTHFKEFYPRYDVPTPGFHKELADKFGKIKYPEEYKAESGVINTAGKADAVKEGIAEMKQHHLENPHLKFFAEANPGYVDGDELVCIIKASFDNLNDNTQKLLSQFASTKNAEAV